MAKTTLIEKGQILQCAYYGEFNGSGSNNNWSLVLGTAAFTPRKANSQILIMYNGTLYNNSTPSSAGGGARLKRNGVVIQSAQNADGGGTSPYAMYASGLGNMATRLHYQYLDTPNTTSSINYSIEVCSYTSPGSSFTAFGWSVVIMEIAG
jgi:hypothetical protein